MGLADRAGCAIALVRRHLAAPWPAAEFARAWMTTQPSTSPAAVQWRTHWPRAGVYPHQLVPLRRPEPGEPAFTRTDRLPPAAGPIELELLWQERGAPVVGRLP